MAGAFDAYRELWVRLFGPDNASAPTTQTPLVINSDGSINVNTGGGGPPNAPIGYPNINTDHVTVDTTAGGIEIIPANASRGFVTIVNHGTTDVWIGNGPVTIGVGVLLVGIKGAAITIPTTSAVYGIVDTGSQEVSYIESYH